MLGYLTKILSDNHWISTPLDRIYYSEDTIKNMLRDPSKLPNPSEIIGIRYYSDKETKRKEYISLNICSYTKNLYVII